MVGWEITLRRDKDVDGVNCKLQTQMQNLDYKDV